MSIRERPGFKKQLNFCRLARRMRDTPDVRQREERQSDYDINTRAGRERGGTQCKVSHLPTGSGWQMGSGGGGGGGSRVMGYSAWDSSDS
jgi:hypothetical protein